MAADGEETAPEAAGEAAAGKTAGGETMRGGAERGNRLSVAARRSETAGVEEIAAAQGERQRDDRQGERDDRHPAITALKGEQLQTKSRGG